MEINDGEDYCRGCDVKIQRDAFEEESKKYLREKQGDSWERDALDRLKKVVEDIFEIKETTSADERTVTTQSLINIFESELYKKKRQERYEDKRKQEELERRREDGQ